VFVAFVVGLGDAPAVADGEGDGDGAATSGVRMTRSAAATTATTRRLAPSAM
jgi:hypothetical protein